MDSETGGTKDNESPLHCERNLPGNGRSPVSEKEPGLPRSSGATRGGPTLACDSPWQLSRSRPRLAA